MEGDRHRATILAGGAKILRHRRYWRAAKHVSGVFLIVFGAFWLAHTGKKQATTVRQAKQMTAPRDLEKSQVATLSDDQLLAQFPNTPVALISLPNGKKQLIFLRPEDEAKFVAHL